jgi:multiple antibiotic resistance protein
MTEPLSFALLSFSALFVIIDPVGIVPLFIALTPSDSEEHRRAMALRACLVAWVLLLSFAFGGTFLLRALGVTLGAFKLAGGLLLLLTALDQLRAVPARTRTTDEEQVEGRTKEDVSIVPLAIPLLAGPGSIATSVMLMDRATNWIDKATVIAAITFTLLVAWGLLLASKQISRMLGTMGRLIVERLGGLVLAAFAVQFMIDGAGEALRR